MARHTGAVDFCTAIAGKLGERIVHHTSRDPADVFTGFRTPAAHRTIITASDRAFCHRGVNATDHTGRPGPISVRATMRDLRSIIATEPRIPAAACGALSGDTAGAITGTLLRYNFSGRLPVTIEEIHLAASAPPTRISPSAQPQQHSTAWATLRKSVLQRCRSTRCGL